MPKCKFMSVFPRASSALWHSREQCLQGDQSRSRNGDFVYGLIQRDHLKNTVYRFGIDLCIRSFKFFDVHLVAPLLFLKRLRDLFHYFIPVAWYFLPKQSHRGVPEGVFAF